MENTNIEVQDQNQVQDEQENYGDIEKLNKIRKLSILAIIFTFIFILYPVALVFNIINGINILATNWSSPTLQSSKWIGVLTLLIPVLFGSIASLIFSNKR